MEEELQGLSILMRQRLVRPSYARCVSRELNQAACSNAYGDQTEDNGHSGEGSSTSEMACCLAEDDTITDKLSTGSSSESEYLTADEEIQTVSNDEKTCSDGEDETAVVHPAQATGKRSRSKKRRKRYRQQLRKERFDNLPFTSSEDIDHETLTDSADFSGSRPRVPSLAMLCLRAYCQGSASAKSVPPGLSRSVNTELHSKYHRVLLKEWLTKSLEVMEKNFRERMRECRANPCVYQTFGRYIRTLEECQRKGHLDFLYHCRDTGSIWSGSSCHQYTNWGSSSEATMTGNFGYLSEHSDCNHNTLMDNFPLSALARLIDLYLPKTFTNIPTEAYKTACIRVKINLAKRFPSLVHTLFWSAMPYVWWSRGNYNYSEEAFLHLIGDRNIIKTDEQKALYVNELARMYLDFGEYGKAAKTFLLAGQTSDPLVELQRHVLVAAGLDVGVRTLNQSSAALLAWERVLEMKVGDMFHLSVDAAIASVMCHHCGIPFDRTQTSWYDSAFNWLKSQVTTFPQVQLSLAILHAMQGDGRESLKSFRKYTDDFASVEGQFFAHLPGYGWMNPDTRVMRGNDRHPFEVICAQTRMTGFPVPSMRVIWRRRLHHISFDPTTKWFVGDDDHEKVCFRLTTEGLLACDVHLTLPPLPELLLNPFTGAIEFSQMTTYIPTCHTSLPLEMIELRLPRIYRLYEDDPVTVDLCQWATELPNNIYSTKTVLSWHHADGRSVDLNLKQVIKEHLVQVIKETIREKAEHMPEDEREEFVKRLGKKLELACQRGLSIDYQTVERIQTKEEKETCKTKSRKNFPLFGPRLADKTIIGNNIVLMFDLKNQDRISQTSITSAVITIIDVSSQNQFLNPVVVKCNDDYSYNYFTDEKDAARETTSTHRHLSHSSTAGQFAGTQYFGMWRTENKEKKKRICIYNMAGEEMGSYLSASYIVQDCAVYYHQFESSNAIEMIVGDEPLQHIYLRDDLKRRFVLIGHVFAIGEDDLFVFDTEARILIWKMYSESSILNEDSTRLVLNHRSVLKLLKVEKFATGLSQLHGPVIRAIIAFGNHVLILELPTSVDRVDVVHCLLDVEVPGTPTEACFVGEKGAFLVTATIFHEKDSVTYQENLYYHSGSGRMLALLPGLGHGPHGFLPIRHPGSPDLAQQYPDVPFQKPGWYIYFRDGHGAITCASTDC